VARWRRVKRGANAGAEPHRFGSSRPLTGRCTMASRIYTASDDILATPPVFRRSRRAGRRVVARRPGGGPLIAPASEVIGCSCRKWPAAGTESNSGSGVGRCASAYRYFGRTDRACVAGLTWRATPRPAEALRSCWKPTNQRQSSLSGRPSGAQAARVRRGFWGRTTFVRPAMCLPGDVRRWRIEKRQPDRDGQALISKCRPIAGPNSLPPFPIEAH